MPVGGPPVVEGGGRVSLPRRPICLTHLVLTNLMKQSLRGVRPSGIMIWNEK